MKKILLLLLIIPIMLYANIWIVPFSISKHINPKTGCSGNGENKKCYVDINEYHKPLGIVYDFNNIYSIGITEYVNSYNDKSKSIIFSKKYLFNKNLEFSLNGGFVDGYKRQYFFEPIIYPSVTIKYNIFAMDISGTHEVIFISLRFKIW